MNLPRHRMALLAQGMRNAWNRSENMMSFAFEAFLLEHERYDAEIQSTVIELAYDLQAGSYVDRVADRPEMSNRWCRQVANELEPFLATPSSLLEVGVGEATTLCGVLDNLTEKPTQVLGMDISYARLVVAQSFLKAQAKKAELFLGDIFSIPLPDASVDVVFTSHALESNLGREREALAELLRITRDFLVLIEPAYEEAGPEARARMNRLGYVRGLEEAAVSVGGQVLKHDLIAQPANPENPSAVTVVQPARGKGEGSDPVTQNHHTYVCPITGDELLPASDQILVSNLGFSFPVINSIPLLTARHRLVVPDHVAGLFAPR